MDLKIMTKKLKLTKDNMQVLYSFYNKIFPTYGSLEMFHKVQCFLQPASIWYYLYR